LGTSKIESRKKIAQTMEALKHRRIEIADELEPLKPNKYRILDRLQSKAKYFFGFLPSIQANRDFTQIEKIINELTLITQNSNPSETIIQEVLEEFYSKLSQNANKISPAKLGLVYRIFNLLYSISRKEISQLDSSELDRLNKDIFNELKAQRDILSREFNKLLTDKYVKEEKLKKYSETLNSLNKTISEHKLEIKNLGQEMEKYIQSDRIKQNQINSLNSRLNELNKKLLELQTQKEAWVGQQSQLLQELNQKKGEIMRLHKKLNRYSHMRILEGEYIGNISDKKSKYHFKQKCPSWKMLVGEYVLNLDDSKEILSSNNPIVFLKAGLTKCRDCSEKYTQ
jgi:chromosome segregation ATPase